MARELVHRERWLMPLTQMISSGRELLVFLLATFGCLTIDAGSGDVANAAAIGTSENNFINRERTADQSTIGRSMVIGESTTIFCMVIPPS